MSKSNNLMEIISPKLYITQVSDDHKFLKISGQIDKETAVLVERLIATNRDKFEEGHGSIHSMNSLYEINIKKTIFVAKFTDGIYYRAKIVGNIKAENNIIKMYFIDYGNIDDVSIKNIRVLPTSNPLCQIQPTASFFYLAGILSDYNAWHPQQLHILNKLLNYTEYNIFSQSTNYPLISIEFENADLATYLLSKGFGIKVPIIKQELMLLSFMESRPQQKPPPEINCNEARPNLPISNKPYHVTNVPPAQFTQSPLQINPRPQPPSITNTRPLIINNPRPPFVSNSRTPFGNFSVPPPVQNVMLSPLQNQIPPSVHNLLPQEFAIHNSNVSKQPNTFNHTNLDIGFVEKVLVSYVSNGTGNFTVQLETSVNQLKYLMNEINKRPYHCLHDCPAIGEVCLGRSSYINMIARAIVSGVSSQGCQLYFVDYGGDEYVHYYDIFKIPQEFISQPTIAIQMCLSGIQNIKWNCNLDKSFRALVTDKVLTLRVMPPEGPPLVHYGELYYNQCNILKLIMMDEREDFDFVSLPSLLLGIKDSVLVSYVDSCLNFYVQLLSQIEELNAVMKAVKAHCEQSASPGELAAGSACCAKFPDDGNWYRARVMQPMGQKAVVAYVDYGNEQEVHINDLRTIKNSLILFPAQAIKCALKGFEKGPKDEESTNRFEKLTLEKTLTVHVVGRYSHDTTLVSLVDETTTPPLDIVKTIMEPNITQKTKNTGSYEIYKTPHQVNVSERNRESGVISIFKEDNPVENWREINRQRNNERVPSDNLSIRNKRDDHVSRSQQSPKFDYIPTNNNKDRSTSSTKVAPNVDNTSSDKRDDNVHKSERTPKLERNSTNNYRDANENKRKFVPNNEHVVLTKRDDSAQRSDGSERRKGRERKPRDRNSRNNSLSQDSPPKPEAKDVLDPVDDDADFSELEVAEGDTLDVVVTWLTSPENFYVQPLSVRSQLENMMRAMPAAYRSVRPGAGAARAVLARYPADRALYRATVLERRPDARLLVRYVDFGNKAVVADTDCWRLSRNLLSLPRLALSCALQGVRALPRVDRTVLDARFGASQYSCRVGDLLPDGQRAVLLTAPDGTDVATALLNEGLALAAEATVSRIGTPYYVAHVDTPGQFWLHSLPAAEELERLQEDLAARAGDFPLLDECGVGVLGCARYSADERWYRAKVLDADADITTVRFVDYGNTDVLGPHELRQLPDDLAARDPLAVRCRLHAAPGGTGEWSEAAAARFAELLLEVAEVDMRVLLAGEPQCVELRTGGVDPTAVLVAEGLASADREVTELCFASHVSTPDEFWIQLEAAARELREIEEAMAAADTFPAVLAAEEGALVAAEFPEDGLWYRAQVVARGSAGTEVLFVDYGNACMADELRTLPEELRARPALARQCSIRRTRAGRWSRRAETHFADLAAEGATVFGVRFVASGDRSVVDLYHEDHSVTDILQSLEDEEETGEQTGGPQAEQSQSEKLQVDDTQTEPQQVDVTQTEGLQSDTLQPERPSPVGQGSRAEVSNCFNQVNDLKAAQNANGVNVHEENNKDSHTDIPQTDLDAKKIQTDIQTENPQIDVLRTEDKNTDHPQADEPQTKAQTEKYANDKYVPKHSEDSQNNILQTDSKNTNYLQSEDMQTDIQSVDNMQTDIQSEDLQKDVLQTEDKNPDYSQTDELQTKEQTEKYKNVPKQNKNMQTDVLQAEDKNTDHRQADEPQTKAQTEKYANNKYVPEQSEDSQNNILQTDSKNTDYLQSEDMQTDIQSVDNMQIDIQSEGLQTDVLQTEDINPDYSQTDELQTKEQPEKYKNVPEQNKDMQTYVLQDEDKNIDHPQADERQTKTQTEEYANNKYVPEQNIISQKDVFQTEDKNTDDLQTEVNQAVILQTKDKQTDDLYIKDMQKDDLYTEDSQTDVLQAEDKNTDHPQADEPQTKEQTEKYENDKYVPEQNIISQKDVFQNEDKNTDDLQTEGDPTVILQTEGDQTVILQTKDKQTDDLYIKDLQKDDLYTEDSQTDVLQAEDKNTDHPQADEPQTKEETEKYENDKYVPEQNIISQKDVFRTEGNQTVILQTKDKQTDDLYIKDLQKGDLYTEDSKTDVLQADDKDTHHPQADKPRTKEQTEEYANDKYVSEQNIISQKNVFQTEDKNTGDLQTEDNQTVILQTKDKQTDDLYIKDLQEDDLYTEDSQTYVLQTECINTDDLQPECNKQQSNKINDAAQYVNDENAYEVNADPHTDIPQTDLDTENLQTDHIQTEDPQSDVLQTEDPQTGVLQSEDKTHDRQTEDLQTDDLHITNLLSDILQTKYTNTDDLQPECNKQQSNKINDAAQYVNDENAYEVNADPHTDIPQTDLDTENLQTDHIQTEDPQSDVLQTEDPQTGVLQSEDKTHDRQTEVLQTNDLYTEDLQADELQSKDLQTDIFLAQDINVDNLSENVSEHNEDPHTDIPLTDLDTGNLKRDHIQTEDVQNDVLQSKNNNIADLQTDDLCTKDPQVDKLQTKDLQMDVLQTEDLQTDILQAEDLNTDDLETKRMQEIRISCIKDLQIKYQQSEVTLTENPNNVIQESNTDFDTKKSNIDLKTSGLHLNNEQDTVKYSQNDITRKENIVSQTNKSIAETDITYLRRIDNLEENQQDNLAGNSFIKADSVNENNKYI